MSSSLPVFSMDESSYSNRAFRHEYESQSESFHGQQGVYSRKHSLLLPPSSSSNIISTDSGQRSRLHSDPFPVLEKPESLPEATTSIETLRLSDIREGLQATGVPTGVDTEVPTGVDTGVHADDITAVNSDTPQRDNDMRTNQSEETLQGSEDPYK